MPEKDSNPDPQEDVFKSPLAPLPALKPSTSPVEKSDDQSEPGKPKVSSKSPAEIAFGSSGGSSSKTLAYKEPPWSGIPPEADHVYKLEEIKNGTIVATHQLVGKSYFVVGRLPACDIQVRFKLRRLASMKNKVIMGAQDDPSGG